MSRSVALVAVLLVAASLTWLWDLNFQGTSPVMSLMKKPSTTNTASVSKCRAYKTLESCGASGGDCVWCRSGAIPSACYSHDEAAQLPPGVFVCDTPALSETEVFRIPQDSEQLPIVELVLNQDTRRAGHAEPLCDPGVESFSGYVTIKNGVLPVKSYFFWFFGSRRQTADTDPLVLWLTGGPGCSSEIALFAENGPCSVNPDGKTTTLNKFSWNAHANLLFVDQPAGTGFSTGPLNSRNEKAVANDLYAFLVTILTSEKGLAKLGKNKFHIFGESYAGHYAPATAHRVLRGNLKNKESGKGFIINLAGLGVGNGLTAPHVQYAYYPEMAQPYVSEATYKGMKASVPLCLALIQGCTGKLGNDAVCSQALGFCNSQLISPIQAVGLNLYDVREKCKHPPLCYDFSAISTFLNDPEIRKSLVLPPNFKGEWEECSNRVHSRFISDWMQDFSDPMIPDLLAHKIPVLIYAGDADYICNWLGNQAWVRGLEWPGKAYFNKGEPKVWRDNKGTYQSFGGLTFLRVFEAGHMVPMDQPEAALHMLDQFLTSGWSQGSKAEKEFEGVTQIQ